MRTLIRIYKHHMAGSYGVTTSATGFATQVQSGIALGVGAAVGVDAIWEFSVVSSNYSAEYGRTWGGVINAITRSATNQLHGSAYEFLRNSALDAKNFFDGPAIFVFRRNQFGGSARGPIKKKRTPAVFNQDGSRMGSAGFFDSTSTTSRRIPLGLKLIF
jgi:hypothetical protein